MVVLCTLLLFTLPTRAQSVQEKKISGTYQNTPLRSFLDDLEKNEKIRTFYKNQWIDTVTINYSFSGRPLVQVLNKLFEGSRLKYVIFQGDALIVYPRSFEQRNLTTRTDLNLLLIGDPLNEGRYKRAVLKGKIMDGKTGESIPGASVYSLQAKKGVTTNARGDYEIELPTGDHTLQVNFMGYEMNNQYIRLIENGKADFELFDETFNLAEVIVTGDEAHASRSQMSMIKVNSKLMKELPVLMGEADVIKSITTMPGIQSVGELSSGFNVRGGNTDQNLVLIDGAPVFNTSHLFGFFSMINPDAVRDVTLFKGGIPARYGERVSSVMEVGLKDGNKDRVTLYGGLGIINSRMTLEGPFKKGKNSNFIIGGRSTYSDWLLRKTRNADFMNSVAHFYDVNAKLSLALGKKNQLEILGYNSFDAFNLNSGSLYNYGNTIGSAAWKYNISKKFISDLKLSYSRYDFDVKESNEGNSFDDYILKTGLDYQSAQYQLSFLPSDKHRLNMGGKYINYHFRPGEIIPGQAETSVIADKVDNEKAIETGLFIDDEFDITKKLTLNLGVRFSQYASYGPSTVYLYDAAHPRDVQYITDSIQFAKGEKVAAYEGLEPRVSLKYMVGNGGSIRMSYQKINQYVNQITNTSVVSPADFFKSSDYYLRPLKSQQYAIGFFKNSENGKYEMSTEIYYKDLENLPEYKNGAVLLMNRHLETEMISANGYSYGFELLVKKASGRLNGWISYSYSRTMRQANNFFGEETINKGKFYPSVYDKPHDLSVIANYLISRRWRFSSNFEMMSGRPATLPELKYTVGESQIVYYSDRNKYRMPPYHRLDVSLTFDENLKRKRVWKGSWTISVYNVYGRNNPYSVYYKKNTPENVQNGEKLFGLFKLSIIGVPIPSITYNFKF
ncbi:MAG: TonB-dependent receptor [Verrucomicrobia bacterium]|nr:TonB-dependent receptor [Prolixibacteraceae bacterium]